MVLLRGGCFCGEVSFVLSAPPVRSAYCHCTLCQRLNGVSTIFYKTMSIICISGTASPFIHTMHFEASAFTWTQTSSLDSFSNLQKPHKKRWRCKNCGTNVSSYNSITNRWSVWGCGLERDGGGKIKNWDIVKPTAHIFYGTRVLDVGDDLGKWEAYENTSAKLY
jgi:hypothetical protein